MNTDHVITNIKTGKFKCEFCGAEEEPPFMPAPIDVIIGAMDYFTDQHKDCKRPQAEAVMSEYIKGFDAGYSYVLNEIERYAKEYKGDKLPFAELLYHLKLEGKPDDSPNKS
jgi:hypothetical protein